jgi:alkanesulfonate monooxygenase SsuD/methylene tetrahydromethanopterin reductase-like flavin-dependent oxidoreductase (luciferase family)
MRIGLLTLTQRPTRSYAEAWEEDLREVVEADRLGISEAWITEHFGPFRSNMLPLADLFICKAAGLTKQIRMGPGIRALPIFHPVQVATEAALCDQLSGGRYMAGFGAGGEAGRDVARDLGIGTADERRDRMFEAMDLIQRCWTEADSFDFDGRFYQCKNVKINPVPLQQPMPVALACSRTDSTLQYAATHGMHPLISFFDPPSGLADMGQIYMDAGKEAGVATRRSEIRMPRFVHVAETSKQARLEAEDWAPHLERRKQLFAWQFRRLVLESGSLADVTLDSMADAGSIFIGDPDSVYQGIKAMYDDVGGFGVLLLMTGTDIGDPENPFNSMRLFMEHVAPRLAKLDPDAPA